MSSGAGDTSAILIVAGETSADRYGARLVERLRTVCGNKELQFFGTGGDDIQKAGVELLGHIRDLASIGPREAFHHLKTYLRTFRQVVDQSRLRRPAVAILIDFPEFNLRLAKRLKRLGIKVIYYISPQLWAWRRGRIRTVRRYVDRMLVILPFEEEYYRRRGVSVEFVGHPLLEGFEAGSNRESLVHELGLDPGLKTIALLPGSRRREVEYVLPLLLEACLVVQTRCASQFVISVAPAIETSQISRICSRGLAPGRLGHFHIVTAPARKILAGSDFAFVKSGTSTLEAALVGTPFLITYRISALSWALGSILVRSRYKGLVNLIAKDEIVPEFLQGDATPEVLAGVALRYLAGPEESEAMRARLAGIRSLLGSRCASETAAAVVAGYLE